MQQRSQQTKRNLVFDEHSVLTRLSLPTFFIVYEQFAYACLPESLGELLLI
jgi:hypothetical protein